MLGNSAATTASPPTTSIAAWRAMLGRNRLVDDRWISLVDADVYLRVMQFGRRTDHAPQAIVDVLADIIAQRSNRAEEFSMLGDDVRCRACANFADCYDGCMQRIYFARYEGL